MVLDALPALILPALCLLALALFMPFTGAREARRREAWARFEALARIRGVAPDHRRAMADWARVGCPDAPHLVLSRRADFDRFARSRVQRLAELVPEARGPVLEALAQLRRRLGFGPGSGRPQSSHDVRPGERLTLRGDDGGRVQVRVVAVDEEGLEVVVTDGDRPLAGPVWATFTRPDDGTFRFRASPLPHRAGAYAHGDFLIHEDRRIAPRIPLVLPPFWVAVERLPDGAAPEDPEGVEVEIVDVSVGGLGLLADRDVRKGSVIGLDLPLGGGIVVRGVEARVMGRGYREGGGRRPHFLHCEIVGASEAQRKVLETFVFSRIDDE